MIVEMFEVGMLMTNCYIVGDPETRKAFVIDPGGDVRRIAAKLKDLDLTVSAILLTHGHFDHITDAWSLKEKVGADILMHQKDEPLLRDRMVGMGAVVSSPSVLSKLAVDRWIKAGDVLEAGAVRFNVLETPGHTPGHVSFHYPESKSIFVGDTLFAGSIGRTDFPGGSYEQLIRSVREMIFPLDGKTVVYPGHGPATTVDREKRSNPFFRD